MSDAEGRELDANKVPDAGRLFERSWWSRGGSHRGRLHMTLRPAASPRSDCVVARGEQQQAACRQPEQHR
jgi:hypothetical protein